MVAHTGLEPVISALRGQRVNQLHQCAASRMKKPLALLGLYPSPLFRVQRRGRERGCNQECESTEECQPQKISLEKDIFIISVNAHRHEILKLRLRFLG